MTDFQNEVYLLVLRQGYIHHYDFNKTKYR